MHGKRVTLEQQRQLAILEEELANRAGQTTGQAKIWPVTGVGFSNGRSTFRTSESQRSEAVAFAKNKYLRVNHMYGAMKAQVALIVPVWSSLLIDLLVWITHSGIA